ncbi:MAG: hypothetical protein NC350_03855 [Corallococcus sp.]|nr:hypothetical protein [Corallococcus sp.]
MVDEKYLVAVESTSLGGAEHLILDYIPEVKSALAFSLDIKTKVYYDMTRDCETIGLKELYKTKQEEHLIKQQHEALKFYVDEKQRRITDYLNKVENARQEREQAIEMLTAFEEKYGLKAK